MEKKLWSRLVSLLVISAMALMIFPVAAFAASVTPEQLDENMQELVNESNNKDYSGQTNYTRPTAYDASTNTLSIEQVQDGKKTTGNIVYNDDGTEKSVTVYNAEIGGTTYDSVTVNYNNEGSPSSETFVKNGVPMTTTPADGGVYTITTGNGNKYTYTVDGESYKITDSNGTVVKEGKESDAMVAMWEIAEANQAVASSASSDGDAAFAVVAVVGAVAVGTATYFLINPDQWLNVRNTVRGWFGMEQLEPELPTEGDFWLNVSNTLRGWFGMEPLPCKPATAAAETVEENAETAENGGEAVQTEEVGAAA